ncbi:class D beta-lactamase [Roseomonas sp. CECT 9278]|uniref:class D beta-lactamase n=1 Tax=Roseomonas sp. CECT 9278 TaxID=2845823 RepID=UPI001E370EA5|nr:class D beta-lactamase [Roseomonas sp. CECT 9278]CAH0274182.1 Beta-lactamase OXA-18 [Roseomonas sp. CECT 9278]
MRRRLALHALAAIPAAVARPAAATAVTVCTLVVDAATGATLRHQGAADQPATPASTFKIPLALMGFDAGVLRDAHDPVLSLRPGDADWLPEWRQPIDPAAWMRHSVVWYSQRITQALGAARFRRTVRDFGYGNADVSGDPGRGNGLARSWIGSSLEITPAGQVAFLRRLLRGELPVSGRARAMTEALVDQGEYPHGWRVFGKTGGARHRGAAEPWGWFVGWARRGDRTVVFARLAHGRPPAPGSPGPAARDAFLGDVFDGLDGL